jgi:hypothetical protein
MMYCKINIYLLRGDNNWLCGLDHFHNKGFQLCDSLFADLKEFSFIPQFGRCEGRQ